MKRLLLLKIVLLFPHLAFADNWTVIHTNMAEYPLGFVFQETDIINIHEGEFLFIKNIEKKQIAVIIIPGEKSVWQGIEEAKEWERKRKNKLDWDKNDIWVPNYLLYKYSEDDIPLWVQE